MISEKEVLSIHESDEKNATFKSADTPMILDEETKEDADEDTVTERCEMDSWDFIETEEQPESAILTENVDMADQEEAKKKSTEKIEEDEEIKKPETSGQHANWIPPELRKPEDEFFDLSSIEPQHTMTIDDHLVIYTTVEGKGSLAEPGDTVYYKH